MTNLFSTDHLEAFYRSHVASRKRPHEDIQAIEREIERVKQYKAKFLSWCWWNGAESECSLASAFTSSFSSSRGASDEVTPTQSSQFKLYNSSSRGSSSSNSPVTTSQTFFYNSDPGSPTSSYHWVSHDHDYCSHQETSQ